MWVISSPFESDVIHEMQYQKEVSSTTLGTYQELGKVADFSHSPPSALPLE